MSAHHIWPQVNARRGVRVMPAGLDQQGRYATRPTCLGNCCDGLGNCPTQNVCGYAQSRAQQAAEAATEIGAVEDEDPPRLPMSPAEALLLCVVLALSAALVAALAGLLWQRWFP